MNQVRLHWGSRTPMSVTKFSSITLKFTITRTEFGNYTSVYVSENILVNINFREQKNEDSPPTVEPRPHHHPAYHPKKKDENSTCLEPSSTPQLIHTNGSGPTQSNSFTAISDVPIVGKCQN